MVLKALYDYYNRCKSYDSDSVPEFGRADVPISFIINIEEDGTFFNIEDVRGESGKGALYRLPFSGKHTNSPKAFLFWDNCTYVIGYQEELTKLYFGNIKKWLETAGKEWEKLKEYTLSTKKDDWENAKTEELNGLKEIWKKEIIDKWKSSTEFKKHQAFISLCKRIYKETDDAKFKAVCEFYDKITPKKAKYSRMMLLF